MARPKTQPVLEDLSQELESLKPVEPQEEVVEEIPAIEPEDGQDELARLRAELAQAKQERDEWQKVAAEASVIEPEAEEEIPHDYQLVSVYVPFNAKGVSKNNGYDPMTGESYVYTTVKVAHKPEGQEHHSMEEFRIRLDSRCVVPRFVAAALGDRADVQEYTPEEEY